MGFVFLGLGTFISTKSTCPNISCILWSSGTGPGGGKWCVYHSANVGFGSSVCHRMFHSPGLIPSSGDKLARLIKSQIFECFVLALGTDMHSITSVGYSKSVMCWPQRTPTCRSDAALLAPLTPKPLPRLCISKIIDCEEEPPQSNLATPTNWPPPLARSPDYW